MGLGDLEFVSVMLAAVLNINKFMRCLHRAGLWMQEPDVNTLISSGYAFMSNYSACARLSYSRELTRFPIRPKMHLFHHTVDDLNSHSNLRFVLNPLSAATPLNEDMIGRICRLNRRVSIRKSCHRTLQTYLINCHLAFTKTR